MHIPEGFLGPTTWISYWIIMIPLWIIASRKVKEEVSSKQIPLLAILSAFSFVIMMFNIPIPGGSTGHAVGAGLIAILISPWAAMISISVVLVIQALLFGDGGITAIAANCFNMAFVISFVSYYAYNFLKRILRNRKEPAAGISAYLGINAGALATAIALGVQPLLYKDASGKALYFPYSLKVTIPAMLFEHIFFFGFAEFFVTVAVLVFISRNFKAEFEALDIKGTEISKKLSALLIALMLLTPLGLIAQGSAWGEWQAEEFKSLVGYIPQGIAKYAEIFSAPFPDYSLPLLGESFLGISAGYVFSAIVGSIVVALLAYSLVDILRKKDNEEQ